MFEELFNLNESPPESPEVVDITPESPEVVDITPESPEVVDITEQRCLENRPVFIDLTGSPSVSQLSPVSVDTSASPVNSEVGVVQEVTQDANIPDPWAALPPGSPRNVPLLRVEDYQQDDGKWINFTRVEQEELLLVTRPEDVHNKTLLVWQMFGWVGGWYVAPCILDAPRTCYVQKLAHTCKDLRKLNNKPLANRAVSAKLSFQQRYGTHSLHTRQNRWGLFGKKPDTALMGQPKYESGLFHHPFLAVGLGIVEENLVLAIDVPVGASDEDILKHGVKYIDCIGLVNDKPSIHNDYRVDVGNTPYTVDAESHGNLARFINTGAHPGLANCALVMETDCDYNNMCVYLTKDVDTTNGPVMLYLDPRKAFHQLVESDLDVA
ncbi:hypothetical protein CYMTET_43074 [Cymbomonas tetramitiformis]|uniref:Uncharacterized protein n=1 Tax=Cymbomonas tetramitiformis TaxID=36881 RepID=A0AAE0BD69_9CHLO|nr:hypothetical protein CYMTET_55896 [Cymbomonas tetramitiformis]KAK3247431.1 hypothetical protein CYMTET_43074 [Cymbomonas tetramitiformis]